MTPSRADVPHTQIHTVGDDGYDQTHRTKKRLRVSRACDQCRKRRDRCDGQQPTCHSCLNSNRLCTYNESTRKRGLPTGYVRAIETIMGFLFCHIDGCEELITALFQTQVGELRRDSLRALDSRIGSTNRAAKVLLNTWRESEALEQLGSFLLVAESAEDDEAFLQRFDHRLAHLHATQVELNPVDPSSLDRSRRSRGACDDIISPAPSVGLNTVAMEEGASDGGLESFDQGSVNDRVTLPKVSVPSSSHLDTQPSWIQAPRNRSLDGKHLPPHWFDLLDIHFADTHCWFPISQKHDLLRTAHSVASISVLDHFSDGSVSPGDLAFLWATIAYTAYKCNASGVVFDTLGDTERNQFSPQSLYALAFDLILPTSSGYEPGHVRALLMLALVDMARTSVSSAWTLVGQAVYIATDLQIIKLAPTATASGHILGSNNGGHRRVGLGCFLLDTVISAHLGRRPYLRRLDLDSIGMIHIDSDEEWETLQLKSIRRGNTSSHNCAPSNRPARILSTFNHLLSLVALINDVICCTEASKIVTASRIASQALESWKAQLPLHCRAALDSPVDEIPLHQLNIELVYVGFRGFLNTKLNTTSAPDPIAHSTALIEQSPAAEALLMSRSPDCQPPALPPVMMIYLRFYLQAMSASLVDSDGNVRDADCTQQMKNSLDNMDRAWRLSGFQEAQQSDAGVLESDIVQTTNGTETSQDENFVIQNHVLDPFLTPISRNNINTNSMMPDLSMCHGHASSLAEFPTDTNLVPSAETRNIELESSQASVLNQSNEDELFRGLAMLDPIDWDISQSDFMSHLGFMSVPDVSLPDLRSQLG